MGRRRADRERARQRYTRHVWIRSTEPWRPPSQGFVVEWCRYAYRWSALTVHLVEVEGRQVVVQEWIEVDRLLPVAADPQRCEDELHTVSRALRRKR